MALFCFAISPIRRQIGINKGKGDEGGLCFEAAMGSSLLCLLTRKEKLRFPESKLPVVIWHKTAKQSTA